MSGNDAEPKLPDDLTEALLRIAQAVVYVAEKCVGKRLEVEDVIHMLQPVANLAKEVADAVKDRTGERHVAPDLLNWSFVVMSTGDGIESVKVETAKTQSGRIACLRKMAGKLSAVADMVELLDTQKSLQELDRFLTLAARADDSAMAAIEERLLQVEAKERAGEKAGSYDGTKELQYFCRKVCPEMRPSP